MSRTVFKNMSTKYKGQLKSEEVRQQTALADRHAERKAKVSNRNILFNY